MACPGCGLELPGQPKFCPECGALVSAVTVGRDVRKTATLLFTDVTGSTALGEELDPEAYRGIMGRYFSVCRAAVERHGGTVEKFVGDAVLAVFGVPDVHEDDALRAVRAAHELSVEIGVLSEELTETLGVRLEIRTGVNTGSVVVGASRAGGSFATGDAVNTAARLEQAADAGEVLIGATTYALVRDAVEVVEVEPVVAKGKAEPLLAVRLLGVDGTAQGRQRRLDAQLIFRNPECRALDDALERTVSTGRGHLVTVLGPPGIGKSRLVAEFVGQVGERAAVLRGRCVSYGHGITYWPVVQVLREAAGLAGGESEELTRHALLGQLTGTAEDSEAVELLLPLIGQGGTPTSTEETFWAVSRVLEQLAVRRPVVVVVDDLHWAEPTLLGLLERIRDETRDLPLLMICGARPELLDKHPSWGQGSLNSSTFGLEPFDSTATATSMEAILGPGVPTDVVEAVTVWTGGNPLFIEEIVAHLVDTGLLARTQDGWTATGNLATAGVPASVSALLASRLDRLPPPQRDLLERAAVIGSEFTTDQAALLAAADSDVTPELTELSRRDLLRRLRGSTGATWAFRHVMIRDAAYDALPKAERAELHARFAEHLTQHSESVGGENLAFVAHHLTESARYTELLAPYDQATVVRADAAVRSAINAASAARLRDDSDGAAALLKRALELAATSFAVRRELLLALLHLMLGDFESGSMLSHVRALVAELVAGRGPEATPLDVAWVELNRVCGAVLAVDTVEELSSAGAAARRMRELAVAVGDRQAELVAVLEEISVSTFAGSWKSTLSLLNDLATLGDAQDARVADLGRSAVLMYGPRPLSELLALTQQQAAVVRTPGERFFWGTLEALATAGLGRPAASAMLDELVETLPTINSIRASATMVALGLMLAGRTMQARDGLLEVNARLRAEGDDVHLSTYGPMQGLLELELGYEPDDVEPLVDEGARLTSPHDVYSQALVAAARSILAARRGDPETARRFAERALSIVDDDEEPWKAADIRRWVSEAWRDTDPRRERQALVEALELYARKEIVTWQGTLRTRVSELSRHSG